MTDPPSPNPVSCLTTTSATSVSRERENHKVTGKLRVNSDTEMMRPIRQKKMGPSPKDVRYIRRELKKLVNVGASTPPEIEETELLLAQVTKITDSVSKDIGELVWIRHHVEEDFMKLLKEDRTLWDGTRLMQPGTRDGWVEYLKELEYEKDEKVRLELEILEKEEQEEEKREKNQARASGTKGPTTSMPPETNHSRKRVLDDEDKMRVNGLSKRSRRR